METKQISKAVIKRLPRYYRYLGAVSYTHLDVYKRQALHSIASIDLKKEEPGLLSLAESWHLLFETFTE